MLPIVLTQQELRDITGLLRAGAQARWLKLNLGIVAPRRADGALSVPRQLYMQKAGIAAPTSKAPKLRLA